MLGNEIECEPIDEEFYAELDRWAEAADLCIPKIQAAINGVADWSSFPDMVSPPAVLVAQHFEIEARVHPGSTDAAMWEALHGLQSLTGLRPRLPTQVDGEDDPTPIELFVFSSHRGRGIRVKDHWPPTARGVRGFERGTEDTMMLVNNDHPTASVGDLLPDVSDQLSRARVVLDNFVGNSNPSREFIDEVDADLAELINALAAMRRALCSVERRPSTT